MKSSREITILLLVAMGLTMWSPALDAACDPFPVPDSLPSDLFPADTSLDQASERQTAHEGDDCCETGCQHCNLPCCAGTAMIPPVAQVLDTALTVDGRLALSATDVTRVDADPLYHPPRG